MEHRILPGDSTGSRHLLIGAPLLRSGSTAVSIGLRSKFLYSKSQILHLLPVSSELHYTSGAFHCHWQGCVAAESVGDSPSTSGESINLQHRSFYLVIYEAAGLDQPFLVLSGTVSRNF